MPKNISIDGNWYQLWITYNKVNGYYYVKHNVPSDVWTVLCGVGMECNMNTATVLGWGKTFAAEIGNINLDKVLLG